MTPLGVGMASSRLAGIKFVSLHEPSGYGIAGRRYLRGLARTGIPVTWTPLLPGRGQGALYYAPHEGPSVGDPELDQWCNRSLSYDAVILHAVPEYLPFWLEREAEAPTLSCTTWETNRLPRHWPKLLNRSARVLVPCSWNRSVFESSGVRPGVDVVPHACSEEELSQASPLAGVRPSDFVFYCIGSWITRKAMTRTIRSYLSTFSRKDPVILVVKTSAEHLSSRLLRRLRIDTHRIVRILQARYRRPARVLLLTDLMSDEDMLGLHARGDCFLSLSRGEGWNLGAFDAASFGRPVIATGMGGPIDFLGGDYPYLVDYRLVQVNDPSGRSSYSPDQLWAEADVEHARQLMREVFHNRQAAEEVAKRTRSSIRSRFSQASIGKQLLRSVELALEG